MIRRSEAIGKAPGGTNPITEAAQNRIPKTLTLRFGTIQHVSDDHRTNLTGRMVVVELVAATMPEDSDLGTLSASL